MCNKRLLNKDAIPTMDQMQQAVAERGALWAALHAWLHAHYDIAPDVVFGGKKYGWLVHYHKGGRTLCDVYPEHGAFTVLIVPGKEETTRVMSCLSAFSPNVRDAIEGTALLHDGLWLWLSPVTSDDIVSVQSLLAIKRWPKRG